MQLENLARAAGSQIHSARFVDAGSPRSASRTEIRALLSRSPSQDEYTVEQFDIGESGIERIRIGDNDLRL